jgi:16S rRNA (cytosine967-C5)-methyltransferase
MEAVGKNRLSARAYALRQLLRIEEEGAFRGLAGGEADAVVDAREERQATEYVSGVTRWRRRLDFVLGHFYRGELDKMESKLRQILRLGLYDILYLETPPHAAVHEAVELAKREVRSGAGGLVNGILRAVLRAGDRLPEPETGDAAEDLAIRNSHPTWMVRRWLDRFGPEDTGALLRWNNERPVYGVRIAGDDPADFKRLLDEAEVEWEASPYLDYFVRVRSLQPILRAGWLGEGRCAVQDESAGLVVRLLDPQPGETIIDGCAAPGGKSMHAAAMMRGEGRIIAFDVHENRLRLLHHSAKKAGIHIIETQTADLRELATSPDRPLADRVLLDAPCSGHGVLSKRADLRWNRREEDIEELARLQDDLLNAAAALVRPGGLLVYSTCTIEPEENRERIEAFLTLHPGFELESAEGFVPAETLTGDGYYETLPFRHGVDGAFGARLRRR